MKKSLLLLIAIALCAIMANAENYGINVGGVEVSSSNYSNVTGGNITGGTVTYNNSSKTLTLTNVTITRTTNSDYAVHNRSCDGLTIVFNGTSNLTSTKAHGLKLDKSTTLYVSSGATVNVNSGTGSALYLGNIQVWFDGSGTINFKTTQGSTNACIKGSDATEAIYDGAHVTAKSYNYYAMEMLINTFHAGTDLRLYYNGVKQQVYNCILQNMISPANGAPAILEPYGAYVNTTARTTIYTSSGEPVRNTDIYISDNYKAILNASYFPDANFRNALLYLYPKGYMTSTECNSRKQLYLSDKGISNLEGILNFPNLTLLECNNNFLTYIPTLYYGLKELYLANNLITSVNNPPNSLEILDLKNNKISSSVVLTGYNYLKNLDLSGNTSLPSVDCSSNVLTSLRVEGCSAMTYLKCSNNKLTGLYMTNCTQLQKLYCNNNELSYLGNMGYCTSLTELYCNYNQLTSLSLSDCSALNYLNCEHNKLTSLSIAYNTALKTVYASHNQISSVASFSSGNKATLEILGLNDNKLTSFTAQNFTKLWALGLADNPNLTTVTVTNNSVLKSFSVGNCTALTTLICNNNVLTSGNSSSGFYFGGSNAIKYFKCNNNQLTSLNVSSLNDLTELNCGVNKIGSLDVSNKTKLTRLEAHYNQLTSLNVQGCSSLNLLMLESNKLSSLSVEGCNALRFIQCCLNKINAAGANTLINSLCTIPAGGQGVLRYIYPGYSSGSYVENNVSLTDAQVRSARNKRWIPYKYNGNGWVEIPVTEAIPGDVNGDGVVTAADITALYDFMLNNDSSHLVNGDQTGDGQITAADITAVYSIMLQSKVVNE